MQKSNQWNTGSLTFCVLAEILEYWTLLSKFLIMQTSNQWNTGSFTFCVLAEILEYWTLLSKF